MWVILPVKGMGKSKQRLASVLSEIQRERLAEAMLNDVLTAISKTREVNRILVVTSDLDVAEIARHYQAEVLMEPVHCSGLNEAVELGVHHAELHGGNRVLVLHADLPLANHNDLSHLINCHLDGGLSIVPDKVEGGTNGMMFDLPTEMSFHYGEGSYGKHTKIMHDCGLFCIMTELPDLTLDIDSAEDLFELSQRIQPLAELATAQCLLRPDMQQVLAEIATSSISPVENNN